MTRNLPALTRHATRRWGWLIFSLLLALTLSGLLLRLSAAPLKAMAFSGGPVKNFIQLEAMNQSQAPFAPDVVLVGLKPGVEAQAWLGAWQAGRSGRLPETGGAWQVAGWRALVPAGAGHDRAQFDPLRRIQRVRLTPGSDVLAAARALSADPAVAFAEPDYRAQALLVPNDADYALQWGLPQVGAPAAWELSTGANSAVIAVVDSGLDLQHEDLSGQAWVNLGEIPGNGLDDEGDGYVDDLNGWNFLDGNGDVGDENGHGTQVAGVASAAGNNGLGVAGLCWDCRLLAVKVMQTSGAVNYSDIAAGVAYAAAQGARVINLSLGGYADSATLHSAIQSAAATAVVVAGAGNDDRNAPFYPAAYPEVLAVGASDSSNHKASFSNYGEWVDLAAPGVAIRTTFAGNDAYGAENGTSLSAPFVSGAAGLLFSLHPDWSPDLVRQQLVNTTQSLDGENPDYTGELGAGLLQAGAALSQPPQAQLAITGWSLDGQAGARPAPGESYSLVVDLENTWLPVHGLAASLSEGDPYASLGDSAGSFGDLNTLGAADNRSDPFAFSLASNTPYGHAIRFALDFSGQDGYAYSLPFTLTVRSGEEHLLGGTNYIEDETWTADKTYYLDGNVVVGAGVTLTVQAGTKVYVKPDSWLRVDGTLIADGSESQPIVFTTQTAGQKWAGLRFTDSSVAATFDASGNYLSGSRLRFVELSEADTAVTMTSRAAYIERASFAYNQVAVKTGMAIARIENSHFDHDGTGIQAGNGAVIRGNTMYGTGLHDFFAQGGFGIFADGMMGNDGQLTIQNNDIQGYSMGAINLSNVSAHVLDNRLVDNLSALSFSSAGQIIVQHNLIAGNWGAAVNLISQTSGRQVTPSSLTYNPDRDEYLLVMKSCDSWNCTLQAQRLNWEGEPQAEPVDLLDTYLVPSAELVYNPERHEYGLIFLDSFMPDGQVSLLRIDQYGHPLGSKVALTNYSDTYDNPQLVYQSAAGNYLAAWVEQFAGRVQIQAISAEGLAEGDPISLADGLQSLALGDLAYDPVSNRSLVVYSGLLNSEPACQADYCLFGAWISATNASAIQPAFTLASPGVTPIYPQLAAGVPGQLYLSWQGTDSANSLNHLYGTVISATLPLTGSVTLTGTFGIGAVTSVYTTSETLVWPNLSLGAAGSEYLLTVGQGSGPENAKILAQRVSPTGQALVNTLTVHAFPKGTLGGLVPGLPAANTLHNQTLIFFGNCAPNVYCGQKTRLFGQLLAADGSQIDSAWTAADESDLTIAFPLGNHPRFRDNTLIHNSGNGLRIEGEATANLELSGNNWFDNGEYDVVMAASKGVTVTVAGNYWGGIPSSQIAARIYDCNDTEFGCNDSQTTIGRVTYVPPLSAPAAQAPAYVQQVEVSPDPMGIERGTFQVQFSHPMLTGTLPVLSFHDLRDGKVEQQSSLAGVYVATMAEDVLGRIWFSCQDFAYAWCGVWRYNGSSWDQFTNENSGLAVNDIGAINGASNGDVWFGHINTPEDHLSRLVGSTWITYTLPGRSGGIRAIAEDNQGGIWFQSWGYFVRFNGVDFDYYIIDSPNASSIAPLGMANDPQGRMWFAFADTAAGQGTLVAFDGTNWQYFSGDSGLPAGHYAQYPFVDARGDLWVGLVTVNYNLSPRYYAARYHAGAWTYYNEQNTAGKLTCPVQGFSTDPRDDRLLAHACGGVFYDGQDWNLWPYFDLYQPFLYDRWGNFWYKSGDSRVNVLWGGWDYPVVDEAGWISPTLFRASYDMTPLVPQGTYSLTISGAVGADGMLIAPDASHSFLVNTAGSVSDESPPSQPVVTLSSDGSLNRLSLKWSSSDPQGIAQFRYAVGTTPGGRDLLDWRYLPGGATGIELSGLLLANGQSYYAVVAAQNNSGLWSQNGVSNVVIGGQAGQPASLYLPLLRR